MKNVKFIPWSWNFCEEVEATWTGYLKFRPENGRRLLRSVMIYRGETASEPVLEIGAPWGSKMAAFIYLYGSAAQWKSHAGSDIDICLQIAWSQLSTKLNIRIHACGDCHSGYVRNISIQADANPCIRKPHPTGRGDITTDPVYRLPVRTCSLAYCMRSWIAMKASLESRSLTTMMASV